MIYLESSNGRLAVDSATGVVDVDHSHYSNDELRQITRFDLVEWRKQYPGEECEGGDILDFGYWVKCTVCGKEYYEPPVATWREEFMRERNGAD